MRRLLVCLALMSATAFAQPMPIPPPTVILIRPALPPVPALKYRIIPERRTLIPGNAAVFYHRAIEMQMIERNHAPNRSLETSAEETLQKWLVGPIGEINREQAKIRLEGYQNALHELELGTTRQVCDWEFDLRKEGFALLLSDVQEMRGLGRLVALRVRVAVLEGKTEEAVHWLRIGFVMSRHVSQGPTLIQALIGASIEASMVRALEDLIQISGTPSLYWALSTRPRPFIDLTPAFEGERTILERELPALRELETGPWTLDKTRAFGDDLRFILGSMLGTSLFSSPDNSRTSRTEPPQLKDLLSRLALAAQVSKIYPQARAALLAQGRLASDVDAMPMLQVATIYTMHGYEKFCDDVYKWTSLPFWQSSEGLEATFQNAFRKIPDENQLLAQFMSVLPALQATRLASVRVDRQLDALQCIEAIRAYAASHNGTLPPTLEALTDNPAPFDPATGKSFEYKVDGASATLTAPLPVGAPDHWSYRIRYELKLAR